MLIGPRPISFVARLSVHTSAALFCGVALLCGIVVDSRGGGSLRQFHVDQGLGPQGDAPPLKCRSGFDFVFLDVVMTDDAAEFLPLLWCQSAGYQPSVFVFWVFAFEFWEGLGQGRGQVDQCFVLLGR